MDASRHTIGLLMRSAVDRALLGDFLREAGHPVADEVPAGGLDAWGEVSLVIADVPSARHHGQALLALRGRCRGGLLPLLVALGAGTDGTPWLHAGFDDVLHLPIRKAELAARLNVFLRLHAQSEQRYRTFFENALVGLYRLRPDGRLLTANPALVDMLGCESLGELARRFDAREVGPERSHEAFGARLAADGRLAGLETTWHRRDGRPLTVLENVTATRDEEGRLLYLEGVVEDVTQRKRSERAVRRARDAAEAANRAKSEFLANMSHEIRTPLTGILGFARLLGDRVAEQHVDYARRIERGGHRLLTMLDGVLTLSRLEAGTARLDRRPQRVAAAVERAAAEHRDEADARGLTLSVEVDPEAREARAAVDEAALRTVLHHLLDNALKFTDEGGATVTVTTAEAPPRVVVQVRDTGDGIDPTFLPEAFDAFSQASTGRSRSHEGSGLGLTIVRRLLELMDGTAEVTASDASGTTVTLTLPLLVDETDEAAPSAGAPPRDGVHVLVVEDHADTRELMDVLLREVGRITLTAGAEEACHQAAETPFDLVFVDINLGPGQDGTHVLERLRALPAYAETPIVALTAYALPGDGERFLEIGFTEYVAKPFDPQELTALARRLVTR